MILKRVNGSAVMLRLHIFYYMFLWARAAIYPCEDVAAFVFPPPVKVFSQ